MEFFALSMLVTNIETQIKIEMSSSTIPPRSLTGRNMTSILNQVFTIQLCPSPRASSAKYCWRRNVRSSWTRALSSLRSLDDKLSRFPPQRPSNWCCRSVLSSSREAMLALREGLETEGADLMHKTGSRIRPEDVYTA